MADKVNGMSVEEQEKQRQAQMQYQAQMQKYMQMNQIQQAVMSIDTQNLLKALVSHMGISLFSPNPIISQQLLYRINADLFNEKSIDSEVLKKIGTAMNVAVSTTSSYRMQFGFGYGMGNQMMGGMGFGMNPMMGMGMGMQMPGMNPMMGGMGFGMNPMMGMGMNTQPQAQQGDDENAALERIKNYIQGNLNSGSVDPLVFLEALIANKIEIDFSEDQMFGQLCSQAIIGAINNMNQFQFGNAYTLICWLYQQNIMQNWQNQQKGSNGQQNQNQFMNPMMGMGMMGMQMPGMNPMMGMGMQMPGMNPMMGMGMQMPGMNPMMGMQNGFDSMNLNPMGMQMPGMNPMMGMGMGMQMPGMNQFGGNQSPVGTIF